MIENWRQASEEEQKFEQKDAGWLLMFSVIGCLCILPLGALGIWQAYDIYAIYEDGISLGFLITSLLCGVVMLLAVLVCGGYWKSYRSIRGGAVYCSHEGRVERTWQEKDDKSVLEYFSFTYRDMVTGEKKEHKSLNFGGKNRLEVGDALCVLAYEGEDSLEIRDVFKEQGKKKADASWIVLDGAILLAMVLAWIFLYPQFGVAALYIRLVINLTLLSVAGITLLFGIFHRKVGAIISALVLSGVLMLMGVPGSLGEIGRDLGAGPREIQASISTSQREKITRTRRGRRRTRHYSVNISSTDIEMREVEVTRAAYEFYKKQQEGRVRSGKMIYYPNTKIFLYFLMEED